MSFRSKKIAGQLYTFVRRSTGEKDTGILPNEGESNDFARWKDHKYKWLSWKFLRQDWEASRRNRGMADRKLLRTLQVPGELYTFKSSKYGIDSGVLPAAFGESNDFAYWSSDTILEQAGMWKSRKFRTRRVEVSSRGEGPSGLLGRMKYIIRGAKRNALWQGYAEIKSTPEQMVEQWESQKGKCAACGKPIDLLKSHYDHNHDTGAGRGFLDPWCNRGEGAVRKMTDEEFENFVSWERRKRNIS